LRLTVPRAMLPGASSLRSRALGRPAWLRFVRHSAQEEANAAIVESTEEYKYVERLIPPTRVPAPPAHAGATPSGWRPPACSPPPLPYMVRRSRMHNIPVYDDLTHGNRVMTLIRKIEGDIWALERDVKQHLMEVTGKEHPTQVNEVTMTLKVKGRVHEELKDWLLSQGF
uniref:Large ribosomal subunit protein mL49 n=2 Tax=Tetraodon nigroviridis TaxID=99883 RepID=H3CC95_TETNG